MTRPFNLAGAPALSVNCGFNSQGLPIGLQIGGRPFHEETVLKVGHAYEQNTPLAPVAQIGLRIRWLFRTMGVPSFCLT